MSRRSLSLALTCVGMSALLLACDKDHTTAPSESFQVPWNTVVRFDESVDRSVEEIWASSSTDVFLASTSYNFAGKVNDVRVAHFDGAEWTETSVPWTGAAVGTWGSGPDDVYLAAGNLIHFDGTRWAALPVDAYRVTGTAHDNVFIANADVVLQYNGADWDTLRTLNGEFPGSLVAAPDGALFLSADLTVRIWNGTTWIDSGLFGNCLQIVCAFDSADAYARSECFYSEFQHWDGQQWTLVLLPEDVTTINGTSGADLYAFGPFGMILHYDSHDWLRLPAVTQHWLYRTSGTPSGVAVAGDDRKVLWLDDSGTQVLREADLQFTRFVIAGESYDHFMLYDDQTIYRYDGGIWRETPLPFSYYALSALGGRSMDNMYASVGDGLMAHYDGATWSSEDSVAVPQTAFWVTPSGDVYSIGGGSVYRRGQTWDIIKSGSESMNLLTGDGGDGIVVAARSNSYPERMSISHFDGEAWSDLPASSDFVYDMWAGPGLDWGLGNCG